MADGTISPETGLIYRVYAAFGDNSLPSQYRGNDSAIGDDLVMQTVSEEWNTLSADTQAKLAPFFSPPPARDALLNAHRIPSHLAPRDSTNRPPGCLNSEMFDSRYRHLDTANGKVRIWWTDPSYDTYIHNVASWINTDIWPKYSVLMGREPLSDANVGCWHGLDGKLDIYLTPHTWGEDRATTSSYGPCTNTPAWIWMNGPLLPWQVAHELFHAWQFSYNYSAPCHEYNPFDEALAMWAANYVYPDQPSWIDPNDNILRSPDAVSLGSGSGYSDWAFFRYLSQIDGTIVIPTIYAQFEQKPPLAAIDTAIPGGFAKAWPDFATYGWNQEPLKNSFGQWTGWLWAVPDDPRDTRSRPGRGAPYQTPRTELTLADNPPPQPFALTEKIQPLKLKLPYLTRQYFAYKITDDQIRQIEFKNPLANEKGLSTQVYLKLADGSWKQQDWTGKDKVVLCRDNPDENVTEMAIYFANSDWAGKKTLAPSDPPKLTLRNTCYRIDRVDLSASVTFQGHDDTGSWNVKTQLELHQSATADQDTGVYLGPLNNDPTTSLGLQAFGQSYTQSGTYQYGDQSLGCAATKSWPAGFAGWVGRHDTTVHVMWAPILDGHYHCSNDTMSQDLDAIPSGAPPLDLTSTYDASLFTGDNVTLPVSIQWGDLASGQYTLSGTVHLVARG